jgi:DNA-binding MarR family transcriptional regulator
VKRSHHGILRSSNDLVAEAAREISLFQDASGEVDEAAAAHLGLNLTDLRCLSRLHGGSMTAGDLAAAVGVSRGAMTTALDRLEGAGYVARVRGAADRRRVDIELTEHARGLVGAIWGPIADAGAAMLADYDAEQLAFFTEALRRGRELQRREADRIRALPRPTRA